MNAVDTAHDCHLCAQLLCAATTTTLVLIAAVTSARLGGSIACAGCAVAAFSDGSDGTVGAMDRGPG